MSNEQRNLMGNYIRYQRRIADLSMRQVSAMVGISNPYLSQIERGLRAPSDAVAAGIAAALGVSVDDLYAQDGAETSPSTGDEGPADPETASTSADLLDAIENAPELSPAQRTSLAEIYRSFVQSNASDASAQTDRSQDPEHDD